MINQGLIHDGKEGTDLSVGMFDRSKCFYITVTVYIT